MNICFHLKVTGPKYIEKWDVYLFFLLFSSQQSRICLPAKNPRPLLQLIAQADRRMKVNSVIVQIIWKTVAIKRKEVVSGKEEYWSD